jgi:hypothetical protein
LGKEYVLLTSRLYQDVLKGVIKIWPRKHFVSCLLNGRILKWTVWENFRVWTNLVFPSHPILRKRSNWGRGIRKQKPTNHLLFWTLQGKWDRRS